MTISIEQYQLKKTLLNELKTRYKEYFESKLAIGVVKENINAASIKKISDAIIKFLLSQKSKIIELINNNLHISAELQEPYFGNCLDKNSNLNPKSILEKILDLLKEDAEYVLAELCGKEIEVEVVETKLEDENTLEKNKAILSNPNLPNNMRREILGKFSFLELSRFVHIIGSNTKNDEFKKFLLDEYNKKRIDDLKLLTGEIGHSISYDVVLKIILSEQRDFSLIERAIIHLCEEDPNSARRLFSDYLNREKKPHLNIVSVFLKYCPKLYIFQYTREVVYIEGGDNPWEDQPDIIASVQSWASLLCLALLNSASINNMVVERYPQQFSSIMLGLDELHEISLRYKDDCDYKVVEVEQAKTSLLLQLKVTHQYTMSYLDKRLIETYLLNEIKRCESKSELLAFYRQHENQIYLNQHRNEKFDGLFAKPFPQIKKNVVCALMAKLSQFKEQDSDATDDIKNLSIGLETILKTKHNALLKQQEDKAFYLIFSLAQTREKRDAISISLNHLNTIHSKIELRIFIETLLLDKKIVGRRAIGIGASDTYEKIKTFYDTHFMDQNNPTVTNRY